jgi:DNA-binding NtrC family response regulator
VVGISSEARDYLSGYDWPGNVRELENVIERAIALTAGPEIAARDLPEVLTRSPRAKQIKTDIPLKQAKQELVESFEREYLIQMLRSHGGNVTKAAQSSGVDRRTFHRLLSRYKIQSRDIVN